MWNSTNGQFTTPKEIYSRVILSGTAADTIYRNASDFDKANGNTFIYNISADTRSSNRIFNISYTGDTQNFSNGDQIYLCINFSNTNPSNTSNYVRINVQQEDTFGNPYTLFYFLCYNTAIQKFATGLTVVPLIYLNGLFRTSEQAEMSKTFGTNSSILISYTT